MRLLHIIPSLDWGSAERQLQILLRELPPDRFDQQVILLRRRPSASDPWADRLTALDLPRRIDLAAYGQLGRCVRKLNPDVLHTWRSEACRLATVCCPHLRARHVASLWHWRSAADWFGRALEFGTLWPLAARLAPPWMESSARFAASQVTSIGYGVTVQNDADRKQQCRAEIAAQLGIPADGHLVGFVGPFLRESRVKDAIWAGDLLKVVRDDVHVLIAGYGPMSGRLTTFRRQVQIEDRVHFVSNPRHIDTALDALDCVWITSQTPVGMPTLLEAMARGIPLIATDLPCHRRYIAEGHTGLIVNVGHRAGFARQTLRLLEDPSCARQLAAAAANSVGRRCAVPQVVEEYMELYQAVGAG